MEMIYTGIPLAIMVTLFVYTVRTMNRAEPSTIGKDPNWSSSAINGGGKFDIRWRAW